MAQGNLIYCRNLGSRVASLKKENKKGIV
ncbi:hypothetical protein CCACVL1_20170 [Corchorus capsularis]|uniref:Uncharacterized protein n=1 Tax=Corchorus capsularis TaxID=210143 RepID=A0A1R3HCA4_COCAP|nr:hypothetical protein CCACVL1_20170 [Corchorus capsularis]